jgi:hypothetical protein
MFFSLHFHRNMNMRSCWVLVIFLLTSATSIVCGMPQPQEAKPEPKTCQVPMFLYKTCFLCHYDTWKNKLVCFSGTATLLKVNFRMMAFCLVHCIKTQRIMTLSIRTLTITAPSITRLKIMHLSITTLQESIS